MSEELNNLLEQASRLLNEAADVAALDAVRVAYLGKKGLIVWITVTIPPISDTTKT